MKRLILIISFFVVLWPAHADTAKDFGLSVPKELENSFFVVQDPTSFYFYITDEEKREVTLFDPYQFFTVFTDAYFNRNSIFNYAPSITLPSKVCYEDKIYTVTALAECSVSEETGCSEIQLPDSLITIKNESFKGTSSLRHIKFGPSLKQIGEVSIVSLEFLEELILPESLISVGAYACCRLGAKRIEINKNLAHIGPGAFCNLNKVEKLELPQNLWYLQNSFNDCGNLKEVTLHHVMGPFTNCFNGCAAIERVIIDPEWDFDMHNLDTSFREIDVDKCTFYVSSKAKGIDYARKWGYKVVVDNYPGSNSQVQSIPTEDTSVRRYDLKGNVVNPDADAKRGEILIECIGNEVHKVIQ